MKKLFRGFPKKTKWAPSGYERYIKNRFKRHHGYPLDLKAPQTFSEKIQWTKVYGHLERYSRYVDKYQVLEFVESKAGAEVIIPVLGVYKRTKDIDFDSLPISFVAKATHGSGWNIMVEDKTSIDWNSEIQKMDGWLKLSYYEIHGEANYKPLKGRIIIQKYIEDPSGDLKDYKFFCFKGMPMYIQVDSARFKDHRQDLYDVRWNKLPVKLFYPSLGRPVPKPERFDTMVDICRKLSEDFAFVRVDLFYVTGGQIYFGELTFTPNNGLRLFTPREFDYTLGEPFNLSHFKL